MSTPGSRPRLFDVLGVLSLILAMTWASHPLEATEPAARVDRFGDPMPKDALLRLGARRFGVEAWGSCVAFSPDGKWLAAGDSCGTVKLWEADTGKVVRQVASGERSPSVWFSADSKLLATRTHRGEIRISEVTSGKVVSSFQRRPADHEESLHFPPGGSRLIVVSDANSDVVVRTDNVDKSYVVGEKPLKLAIELLELPGGKVVKRLADNGPETVFSDAALSPDGKLLAVGIRAYRAPRRLLRLLDTASGELVREVKLEGEGWLVSLVFSRDGKALALGSRDEIVVVDVATGKTLNRLADRMSTVGFVGFTPDGNRLVSHSHDNKVRLWDLGTGKVLMRVEAEASGHLVYPQISSGFGKPGPPDERVGKAHSTALSPDGKTLAVGLAGCVQHWDVASGRPLFAEQQPAQGWSKATYSPDGRLLLVGNWKQCRLWDSVRGEVHRELPAGVAWGAFSPDGKQLAFAYDPRDGGKDAPAVILWDVAASKEVRKLEHPRKERFSFEKLAFGPDGRTLLTLSTHCEEAGYPNCTMVYRWDTRTGAAVSSIHRGNTNGWPSAIAPDGRRAAIVLNDGLLLSDVVNDEDLWRREDGTPERWSGYPLFSPDAGFLFVWTRDGYVGMWEIATRSVVARVALRRDANLKMDKWPSSEGGKRQFDREIPSDQPEIKTVAVSPDSRFLATSEHFNTPFLRAASPEPTPLPVIRIWEAASGKVVQKLEGFRSVAISLSFSPDGHRLASAFDNDTVLVWDVSRAARPQGARKPLSRDQIEKLWKELGAADAATAYTALTVLQESPEEAVPFLGRHVRPVPAAAADRVRELIRKLESARFAEREASEKELRVVAAQFRTTLKKAAKEQPTLEVRRRLEAVLSAAPAPLPFESLRTLRSIQLLERIGSVEAQRVLRTVTEGAAEAHETLAAKEALQRLSMRVDAAR